MKDFEAYIKANKQKLEIEGHPNPEIWLSIENQILRKKNQRNRRYIKYISAAAAILLLTIIAMSGLFHSNNDPNDILAQYGIENHQFAQQVADKTSVLAKAKIPTDRKKDFDLLLKQLAFLDAQYQDYLQYINEQGFQPFIGEQILHYYQSKIELLNRIQQEIEKINYYEKKFKSNSPTVQLNI